MVVPWLLLTNRDRKIIDKPAGRAVQVGINCVKAESHSHGAAALQKIVARNPLPLNADQLINTLPLLAIDAHFYNFAVPIGCGIAPAGMSEQLSMWASGWWQQCLPAQSPVEQADRQPTTAAATASSKHPRMRTY